MSPSHIPIELGVGNNHPSNKSNMTQIGTFVLVILTSSTVFASTSFCISVWMMSRPASCRFCCATTCWVFSLPAKTFAFTVGPPLPEKGLRPVRPQLDNNRVRHRLFTRMYAVVFFMCYSRWGHSRPRRHVREPKERAYNSCDRYKVDRSHRPDNVCSLI